MSQPTIQPKLRTTTRIAGININPASIEGVTTSTAGFLGETEKGPITPTLVKSWQDYQRVFGGFFGVDNYLPYAVQGFFLNGGGKCYVAKVTPTSGQLVVSDYIGTSGQGNGLAGLAKLDDVSIVYAPNSQSVPGLTDALISHCEVLKNRFAIIDSVKGQTPSNVTKPRSTSYAALYFPWIKVSGVSSGQVLLVPSGGHVAGTYARSDLERGVQKAPANVVVEGVVGLEFSISSSQQDLFNLDGINCIRSFLGKGITVWGARTLSVDSLWKYVSIRRLFTYLENSILKGTQWVIFEPNNQITWTKAIQTITEFLRTAWKNGVLQGAKPEEAFFVKCDRTTMTQSDIDNGRILIVIGVAPTKPAEFIVFRVNHSVDGSGISEG